MSASGFLGGLTERKHFGQSLKLIQESSDQSREFLFLKDSQMRILSRIG